jgi:guanylate kinase
MTTRPPRPGEVNGVDYFFVTADEFATKLEEGELLEHAAVHGHFYGSPRSWVLEQLAAGTDVVLEIDVQGAIQVRSQFPQAILIFLAPPSWKELTRRLRGRNTEDEAAIRHRLHNARIELARVDQYEYLIINDRLDDAVDRLRAVVLAERSRPWRQDIEALLAEDPDNG